WTSYPSRPGWGGNLSLPCASGFELVFGCKGILQAPGAPARRSTTAASSRTAAATEVVGGSDEQRALLRPIVDALQPSAIERIELRSSNDAATLVMHAPDSSVRTLRQESLMAGAFRDRAK